MITEINYSSSTLMPKPFPRLVKQGIVMDFGGEITPFVFKGRMMLMMQHWTDYGAHKGYAGIMDYFSGEKYPPFGEDMGYMSAYCEDDIVYAFGTLENKVYRFTSSDLIHWNKKTVVEFPENFELFNTSVCRGDGGYMMAVECAGAGTSKGHPAENRYIGVPFTEFFASSPDLEGWELLPLENGYSRDRYVACPALRYAGGWYYMICLEALPLTRYAPYIYRTKDFVTWEIGLYNPILLASEEDRHPKPGAALSPESEARLAAHMDINNSDVDLCEYGGRTYVLYQTGNQQGDGTLCEAVFDGGMQEFLEAYFN